MTRVVAFGTFDILHPGHLSFLEQAKKHGDYLLVVIARDREVKAIKGKLPFNSEVKRARQIRKVKIADKVVLGSKTHNYYRTIRTHKINLIVLGYDQKPTIQKLKRELKRHQLTKTEIIRVKAYKPKTYKSSLLTQN